MSAYANAVKQYSTATVEEAFLLLYARFLGAPGEGQEEGVEIAGFFCCFDPQSIP
jgi:hypothetical protein